jgi:prostaglandin-H2 D-isomerase / glutathione transferase
MTITLTYFDIEGVAEPVRLALLLTKTPFEDHRIKFPEWSALKPTTPFGVLPVMTLEENGPMRSQSKALLRYIGTTYNASPSSYNLYPADKLLDIEEAIGVVEDMNTSFSPALYIGMNPTRFGHPEGYGKTEEGQAKIRTMREAWITSELPKWLGFLETMLTKNGGTFLVGGDTPTDCVAIAALRNFTRGHLDYVNPECLAGHPTIVQYIQTFCALPEIQGKYTDGVH